MCSSDLSLGAALVMPPLVALTPHKGGNGLLWFSIGLAVVVLWAHRANVGRLLRGEENRFGKRGRQAKTPAGAEVDP